ncbi:hypothetical protein ACVXSW_001520 [Vibrio parahaemolyticus]
MSIKPDRARLRARKALLVKISKYIYGFKEIEVEKIVKDSPRKGRFGEASFDRFSGLLSLASASKSFCPFSEP